MEKFSLKQGEELVKMARQALEKRLLEKKTIELDNLPKELMKNQGAFVTLHDTKKELRGCIGYPYPKQSLAAAVRDSTIQSALFDLRFKSIKKEELDNILIEITILGEPKLIEGDPKDRPKQVDITKHALFVEFRTFSGFLLPQVPIEEGWDAEMFLGQACFKAGLSPDTWLSAEVKIYKMETQIFKEEANGKIVEEILKKSVSNPEFG